MRAFEPYLPDNVLKRRAETKRTELIGLGFTPDWYLSQAMATLPQGLRVAVVGGGLAGLSAAWYLVKCRADVTLYEASATLGGRVRSSRSFVEGKVIEDGAELVGENHPLWGIYARKLGLTLEPMTSYEDRTKLKVRTRMSGVTYDHTSNAMAKVGKILLQAYDAMGDVAKEINSLAPWEANDAKGLDSMTVASALDDIFKKMSGSDVELARRILDFSVTNDNCASTSRQSYLGLLASVSAARMGNDLRGMRGYWFSTETHRCKGGNDLLATALLTDSMSRLSLHTRSIVTSLKIEAGFRQPVHLVACEMKDDDQLTKGDCRGRSLEANFDYVVLAVPPTVWRNIDISPRINFASRSIQHGGAVKAMFAYESPFWEGKQWAPTAKWDELGSVWEGTDNQSERGGPHVLTVFSGGPQVRDREEYPERMKFLYSPPEPPKREGIPIKHQFVDWPTMPFIETGYAVPNVGEVTNVMNQQSRPHEKRLYFAGEQTSPGFFGYMEGALQSGARAARDIVEEAARPTKKS